MNQNSKNISRADYQSLAEFRYQMRRFLHFSEEAARKAGIEPQQHQLMLTVKGIPEGEEPRIAYLAERLQIQHHSAVELVDRMEKKGLLSRERATTDRREVHVQLTALGGQLLADLTKSMRAELRMAAPALVATLRRLTPREPRLGQSKAEPGAPSGATARRSHRTSRVARTGAARTS
ncbi:MAG TPA: MarR family transcriptional regulator [Terriglobales bacterium]|jgi:DNA-binding MarR family transcriptional regulator